MADVDLRCGEARARLSTAGAEWLSWSVGPQDLLWSPDPAFWEATAPILFPVCGWTRDGQVRVAGATYPLSLHGFARHCTFEVEAASQDHVTLALRDDAATRALYPFAFRLSLDYRLCADAMAIEARITNAGQGAMPFAFGLHPGFARRPDGAARIVFDEAERAEVPVIAPGGLFSAARRAIPLQGRTLALGPETFAREALCFVPARSRGVVFEDEDRRIRVEFPDFANLVLWSRPGAPFLCIEPWTGFGDPEGFAGDLFEKPGMSVLAPGETAFLRARFTLL